MLEGIHESISRWASTPSRDKSFRQNGGA
jgi:hypothetical protein